MHVPRLAGLRAAGLAAILHAAGVLSPAIAQAPSLAMLGALDNGQWDVRFRENGERRRICVQSGLELVQLQHAESGCSRFVVEDGANAVTVQYSCRGSGYGRTNIRRESNSLVQIDSQGSPAGSRSSMLSSRSLPGASS